MGTLNDWVGTIGGTILGIELIALLIVGVALNAGIAFGLYWVLKKMGWVHTKVSWALALYEKYVDKGANIAAAPVILTSSFWRGFKAGLHRATHWPPMIGSATPPAAQLPARSEDKDSRAA